MTEDIAARLTEAERRLDALHRRVLELEAEIGLLRGTLERQAADEVPTRYIHDVAPNAPR